MLNKLKEKILLRMMRGLLERVFIKLEVLDPNKKEEWLTIFDIPVSILVLHRSLSEGKIQEFVYRKPFRISCHF